MSVVFRGKTYYRTAEACRAAGVAKNTFLRWVKHGTIPDVSTRDGRDWRLFTSQDVAILKAEVSRIEIPRVCSNRSRRLENVGVHGGTLGDGNRKSPGQPLSDDRQCVLLSTLSGSAVYN